MTTQQNSSVLEPESQGEGPDPKLFLETAVQPKGVDTEPRKSLSNSAPPSAWIGRKLGKYEVTGVLGRGGMGFVLKALDPLIERHVAIKLLPEDLAEDTNSLERFLSEAKSAGKLNHPNVVSIYEIGQEGQAYFLVMELIPGGCIADGLCEVLPYSVLNATRIMLDACKGMTAAHDVGLIHRDMKPANLMRAADGSIKITDFGLAKSSGPRARELTQAGLIVGTPYFMSPEQCEGRPVDARSDVYSLGATYYALLTGRNPYQDTSSVMQVMFGHCQGPIPDPCLIDRTIPQACAAIVARAMAKAAGDRYQLVTEMLADLQAVYSTMSGAMQIQLPSQSGIRAALPGSVSSTRVLPNQQAAQSTASKTPPKISRRVMIGGGLGAVVMACSLAFAFGVGTEKTREKNAAASIAAAAPVVPSGEPIKVGVLHSLSGTMAASSSVVVDATLLAIDEINQSGGLLGRPVKAVVADGRSDYVLFAKEAKRLITEEKVSAVFGCWTSAGRKAVKPVFEELDNLLIYPLQYEGLEESPNIIYMGAAPNQQILPALDWAMSVLNKKRFFLVGSDYVFPRAANAIIKDYLKGKGCEVVGEEYLRLGSQFADPVTAAIVKAQPDMILNTINGDSNTGFFRSLRAAGVTPTTIPCLSFSFAEQELRSLSIADTQGDYAAWTYFQTVDSPENQKFVKAFQDKYPQRVISDPMEAAYLGVKMWAKAVTVARSVEPMKVRRALLNQKYDAPSGPTRIDPDTQHSYKTPRVGQIRGDGQFDIVWSAPAPVRPLPYPTSRTTSEWKAFLYDLNTGWGGQWSAP
ncbi:MAG: serine/threonine protein kinase [Planctomycetaceae bacterium]|nr:serine/threonine protein kinase [Planctomycetaceae bacterium]